MRSIPVGAELARDDGVSVAINVEYESAIASELGSYSGTVYI